MVTRKRPFEGDTSGVTFEAILNRQPTPPTRLNAKVAPGLESIITKALEKDREIRYRTPPTSAPTSSASGATRNPATLPHTLPQRQKHISYAGLFPLPQ